jgi:NADPH-dependent 2,4-dienoyl-CoA reductase/sulfur reductase-like enzyme
LETRDLVIIGSGPAGLSAAVTAAAAGVDVAVIGEDHRVGGQIFRQIVPPLRFEYSSVDRQNQRIFKRLEKEWAESKVQFLNRAVAWGIFGDNAIAFDNPKHSILKAKRLLFSEGAYETPVAFPGWTLPGVMTLGAAQTLLKGQGVVPKGIIVIAGTGPLLYYTASQLLKNGAEVAALIEASSFSQVAGWTRKLWRAPGILGKGLKYMAIIKKHRVPIYYNTVVKEALGSEVLEEIVYARADNLWKPQAGTEKRMKAEILCLNFGFTPSTHLSHMAKCGHICDPQLRGWRPVLSPRFETTQPGVFVGGDCTGIGGVEMAVLEGRIAGTEIARRLGAIRESEAERRLVRLTKSLESHRWYQNFLKSIYAFRPGLLDLMTDDTLVCRCEEVDFKALSGFIQNGAHHVEQIKRLTRIGMGRCQGRFCYPTLIGMLAKILPAKELEREDFSARLPSKPLLLKVLFEMSL